MRVLLAVCLIGILVAGCAEEPDEPQERKGRMDVEGADLAIIFNRHDHSPGATLTVVSVSGGKPLVEDLELSMCEYIGYNPEGFVRAGDVVECSQDGELTIVYRPTNQLLYAANFGS